MVDMMRGGRFFTPSPVKEPGSLELALERGAMSCDPKMAEPMAPPSDATTGHAVLGVSCALRILLSDYQGTHGRPPTVLNERSYPLCEFFAPASSFDWVDLNHDLDVPPLSAVSRAPPPRPVPDPTLIPTPLESVSRGPVCRCAPPGPTRPPSRPTAPFALTSHSVSCSSRRSSTSSPFASACHTTIWLLPL